MQRRVFIVGIAGSAAAWPLSARAQQPAMPVIGYLYTGSPEPSVHLLAAFPDEDSMLAQCESWKHFTATKINRLLGVKGRFWQQDGFDHLVRSVEQFEFLRRYIAENPKRANLAVGQYIHWAKNL